MRMGYRTVYEQPSQMQYAPNRFGAYAGGIMYNPNHMGGWSEFSSGYVEGIKSGSLTSYALPLGLVGFFAPIIMPKSKLFKNKKVARAIQVGGLVSALASLYMTYKDTHPAQ